MTNTAKGYPYIEVYLEYGNLECEDIGPADEYFKVDPSDKDTITALKLLKPFFEDTDYCLDNDGNIMKISKKTFSEKMIKKYDSYIDILKADCLFCNYAVITESLIIPFRALLFKFGYNHPIVIETFKYLHDHDSDFLLDFLGTSEDEQEADNFVTLLKLKGKIHD